MLLASSIQQTLIQSGLSGCHDGGGNGLTKTLLITHLRDHHCNGDAHAITRKTLSTNLAVFEEAEVTFKRMGIWLCGGCFKMHSLRSKCRHGKGSDFVSPPDCEDGVVWFVLYDIIKPHVPTSSEQFDHVDDLVQFQHGGFTLALLDSLFSKGLRTVKSIPPKCHLGFSRALKEALDKVICTPDDISCWVSLLVWPLCLLKTFRPRSNLECKSAIKRQRQEESILNAIRSWSLPGGSLQVMRETLAESSPPLSDVDEEDIDLGERNIKQCKRNICDGHYTAAIRVLSSSGVAPYNDATLEDLKTKHPFKPPPSLPHISIDHHHLIASPDVKPFVAILDELFFSITQVMYSLLDGKCPTQLGEYIAMLYFTTVWLNQWLVFLSYAVDGLQFGVRVAGGSEAILHSVNRLIEACGDDVGLSMLLVDFKNALNLVDREVMLREVRSCQGVQQGDSLGPLLFSLVLHPLICKIRDSFSLSLHAWYLDDDTIVGDTMVVGKVLELIMEDGPGCDLHLNVDKTEVFWPKEDPRSRLAGIFPPSIARPLHGVKLLGGPASVDFDFCNELVMKRVAKTIGLMDAIAKINDPQCELLLLRSCTGISRLYFTMRTCPPRVFESAQCSFDVALRSSLERISAGLQTKLLRHTGIVSPRPIFDDALSVFNKSMKTDLLGNPSEIAVPKLMKKMADIYFTRVTKIAESTFSLSPRQIAMWTSQKEDYTSDWLRTVPISGLGQTMNACSRVFAGDIYGDHAVSCAGIIGIKHHHNVVRDTLVDICYRFGISAGKEVDIGLDGGRDKPLRPADMLLYSWDGGLIFFCDVAKLQLSKEKRHQKAMIG
ncbi:hypothetical protein Tco_0978621 [Tanacetum coccineum]|uniref:Reverse transcriptase domain-containing protein n=1 Tax=Tanacetum coccineum TaxID=301880 RepID=A0ABQ5ENR8_9ASTR